jgi:ATP-dependent DNA ligase
VALAVRPPVAPMLARLVRELPRDGLLYEPKWDGFRCLAFRSGSSVDLRSRHNRPLTRYFPEVVDAISALSAPDCVLDGELMATRAGQVDFAALLERLHPAPARVARLRTETPAEFVVFDLLADASGDLRGEPLRSRRERLGDACAIAPPALRLTPGTEDPASAQVWLDSGAAAFDGVMAKALDSPYLAGRRAWWKVKREFTTDCVVAGFRPATEGSGVVSLLLGLYGPDGRLLHIGVAAGFSNAQRAELLMALIPYAVSLAGHPWEHGFALEGGSLGRLAGSAGRWLPTMSMDWIPLRPELVCEVGHDRPDGARLRHPARFRRWRPDRQPRSCGIEQLTDTGGAA